MKVEDFIRGCRATKLFDDLTDDELRELWEINQALLVRIGRGEATLTEAERKRLNDWGADPDEYLRAFLKEMGN